MLAEYVYLSNITNLKKFFGTMQSVGVPDKLTISKLTALGYKSKNDRPILKVLKALGFLASNGVPTERWKAYRNKAKAGAVVAEAIRKYYSDLFELYPDAQLKDAEALRNFFTSQTSVGEGALTYMVRTFQTLTELADFSGEPPTAPVDSTGAALPVTPPVVTSVTTPAGQAVVHVNVQLTLPEGSTSETFEEFFKAMKKYLLS
jgi:hypothetical protein